MEVTPIGYSHYVVNPTSEVEGYVEVEDDGGDPVESIETFEVAQQMIDIWTKDFDILVSFSHDGTNFGAKILLRGSEDETYSPPMSDILAVRFENVVQTGAANGSYQVLGSSKYAAS